MACKYDVITLAVVINAWAYLEYVNQDKKRDQICAWYGHFVNLNSFVIVEKSDFLQSNRVLSKKRLDKVRDATSHGNALEDENYKRVYNANGCE
jgi:hypothetical protein